MAGLGAGLMYLLDPDRGRRRRATIRDKSSSLFHQTGWAAGKTWRDVSHRAQGAAAMGRKLVSRRHQETEDQVVEARVRTRLGRVCSHPGAINVTVTGGSVRLDGAILESEHAGVASAVRSVAGVRKVEDHLHRHHSAEGIPSLQGGTQRDNATDAWTPALRAIAGGAGVGLLAWGLKSRNVPALAAGVAGAAVLARAISNRDIRRVVGVGGGRRAIDIQKTIRIAAPVEDVFRFWSNYENFPKFMRNIREVRDMGSGRSHWTAAGPAGVPVSWDAEITESMQDRVLAWKSTPGSTIENAGIVRFEEQPDGYTRVTVRLSYNPPAGVVGHTVASLFGADPKSEMDEDLMRMKSLLEEGRVGKVERGSVQTRE
jgi:uncharacterized membrane protein